MQKSTHCKKSGLGTLDSLRRLLHLGDLKYPWVVFFAFFFSPSIILVLVILLEIQKQKKKRKHKEEELVYGIESQKL